MQKKEFTDVKLEKDPITYRLMYDANEIVDAETLTGLNLLHALRNLNAVSMGQLRGLLYALLKTGHPTVELKEAGELLCRPDAKTVTDAIWKVLGVKSEDEVLLETLHRIAEENPEALAAMLAKAGAQFEIKKDEVAPE